MVHLNSSNTQALKYQQIPPDGIVNDPMTFWQKYKTNFQSRFFIFFCWRNCNFFPNFCFFSSHIPPYSFNCFRSFSLSSARVSIFLPSEISLSSLFQLYFLKFLLFEFLESAFSLQNIQAVDVLLNFWQMS